MKKYNIEIDETVSNFIEDLSKRINKPVEILISDAIYNLVNDIEENNLKLFSVDQKKL